MKKYIIGFIIGAVIFSGISIFATTQIVASNISYKNTTVESAIDTLYTKAKSDYSGDTTFTPTTSSQTIQTNNKILKSDITINPIPSTYKELSTATTVTANDLLNGITAYDNLGNLITGNISTNCIYGNKVFTDDVSTATGQLIENQFIPTTFYIVRPFKNNMVAYLESYDSNNVFLIGLSTESLQSRVFTDWFRLDSNSLYIRNLASDNIGKTFYYVACR